MAGTGSQEDYSDEDGGGGAITEINVTPLVDITLVLLIIFMVTAKYIVNPAIEVELPKAASGNQVVQKTLSFTLGIPKDKPTAEPVLFLNGVETDWAKAGQDVKAMSSVPDVQAVISADRAVRYDYVVRLIDLVKTNGVLKFALAYDPLPAGGK